MSKDFFGEEEDLITDDDELFTLTDEDGNEIERHASDEEPFSALAFKIRADPFVGK